MKKVVWFLVMSACLWFSGCGTEVSEEKDEGDVAYLDVQEEEAEDVISIGDIDESDIEDLRCDGAVIDEWPLHDAVSSAEVQVSETEGVFEAEIDARAGGTPNAANNPFVYLNLQTGEKAELSDIESLRSVQWDLAFKRIVIRTNSGDSGPGDVRLAKVVNTSFEDVQEAPEESVPHHQDRSFDENCNLRLDPISNLKTAFNDLNPLEITNSWYDYGEGGAGGIAPASGEIYVLRRDDRGEVYKIEILEWSGGIFRIRWAQIEE